MIALSPVDSAFGVFSSIRWRLSSTTKRVPVLNISFLNGLYPLSLSQSQVPVSKSQPTGSGPLGSQPTPPENPQHDPDFYLNVGKAIDTLRTELPLYFEIGLQDFSIYDDRVALTEYSHYHFYVKGQRFYRYFLAGARSVLRFYFSNLSLNIRSFVHSSERQLVVRWTMEGTSRASLFQEAVKKRLGLLTADESALENSVYEGMFIYKFNEKGLIKEHAVANIVPAPRRFVPLSAIAWWQRSISIAELNSTGNGSGSV